MSRHVFLAPFAVWLALTGPATGQQLDVDFRIIDDDQAAGCLLARIGGLDHKGNGFLAVRSGPGAHLSQDRRVAQRRQGSTFREQRQWFDVYYGEPRRKGCVHRNWLVDIDG